MTYDYANVGKSCKALDKISLPLTYMEECRCSSLAKLLGLCRFYRADPETVKSISAPKPLASICRVKCLWEMAKGHGQPYIIVIFEGGNMTPLGLLQELHLWFTLSCIPIFTTDEAKQGKKPCVSCCPICAYIVKNDSAFLNHIVISHYCSNFACGKCLYAIVTSDQQMKKHFLKCHSIANAHEKPDSQGSKSSKLHCSGGQG